MLNNAINLRKDYKNYVLMNGSGNLWQIGNVSDLVMSTYCISNKLIINKN
jgi:hypothetical protein